MKGSPVCLAHKRDSNKVCFSKKKRGRPRNRLLTTGHKVMVARGQVAGMGDIVAGDEGQRMW